MHGYFRGTPAFRIVDELATAARELHGWAAAAVAK